MKLKTLLFSALASTMLSLSLTAAEEAPQPQAGDEKAESSPPKDAQIGSNVAGNYLSGQFARSSGNTDVAIRSLQHVHKEQPEDASIAMQLQGMLLVEGRIDEVMALSDDMKVAGIKDPLATLMLTLRELKNNRLDSASELLDSAQHAGGAQLWLPLLSAWTDLGRNKLTKPLTIDKMGADVGRAAPLINYHLALINSQAGFRDEAVKNFKAAIEDPQNPPTRVMNQLLRFYDHNDAPELLTPLVTAYRETNPVIENDGNIPVIATARDGIAEVLYTMGSIMYGAGVPSDAAIYLQLAAYVKPELSEAVVALGDAYGQLQQFDKSNAVYTKIPAHTPLYSKAQLHIAVNEERMGKFKESMIRLDMLAKQSPKDVEALVTKADLLRIHGQYPQAVDAYTKALKRAPDINASFWPVLFARGSCYEREGKWPEARKDLQKALELKPDQPDVLNYLGFGMLERNENPGEAREMIAKAVKARPDDAQIIDSMGWVLYMEGDYAKSISYLEKAVELLPGDPTVNDHLGDAYWRAGRKNEAKFQWQRALTFQPETRLVDAIHKKLKDGLPSAHMAKTGNTELSATP